jgi:hypothetical protein
MSFSECRDVELASSAELARKQLACEALRTCHPGKATIIRVAVALQRPGAAVAVHS